MTALLRIHAITPDSRVNGPGRRSVLHLQGCTLGCPACFNPQTHPHAGGTLRDVESLAAALLSGQPDGVTVSGGEPFQQAPALVGLLRVLRGRGVDSILIFSGYSLSEIDALEGGPAGLEHTDVLVAGRYDPTVHVDDASLIASENQRIHFITGRHGPKDVDLSGGNVEITIRPDGSVTMTGFPPPAMRRAVGRLDD